LPIRNSNLALFAILEAIADQLVRPGAFSLIQQVPVARSYNRGCQAWPRDGWIGDSRGFGRQIRS
jgi:hypothetical protein